MNDEEFGGFTWLTVCFIDDDWKLKNKMIAFKRIEEGQNAVKCLKNVLLEWGIDNNISSMVKRDYNDRYDNVRENWFSSQRSLLFNSKLLCFDYLEDISDSYLILQYLAKRSLHDRVSKIFNYITETPSKNETFRIAIDRAKSLSKEVTDVVIPTKLELEKNRPQVWFYDQNDGFVSVLENVLGLKRAFFELEDMDHYFKSINLTQVEWDQTRAFYECYEDFSDVSFFRHWFYYRTANMYFPVLCSLYTKSLLLVKKLKNGFYLNEDKCLKFTEAMNNHWRESNLVLAVAAVLDPRFKMDIVKHWYRKIYGDEWESQLTIFTNYFTGVYNEYAKGTNNFKSCNSGSEETNSSVTYEMLDPSGKPSKSSRDPNHVQSLNFELHLYLKEVKFPLIKDFDILKWWQGNIRYFPTLARMARDFLSIQIAPSFEPYENPVLPEDFNSDSDSDMVQEAFLCTRDWLNSKEYLF
ncbi:hypothetical protein Dsin_018726 [Dipteronia sinensis]|uniref:HAT C-terminal dimerisation domain-containing protein n=1 Tax=Dipteronia sinensis TaxID=43782 RepID=A0AAE0A643_9ROSI|nr:hypothetical protein Dsin_018726 [Dipteronia sinensis]